MARTSTMTRKKESRDNRKRPAAAAAGRVKTKTLAKRSGRAALSPTAKSPKKAAGRKAIRTYHDTLAYLDGLTNFERHPLTYRDRNVMTLARVKRLLADLGNPHKGFKSVHIAGTKGKGSTAAMLSEMLQANELTVGLYTSPHILDVRERIRINGRMIPEDDLRRLVARVAQLTEEHAAGPPTFFEVLTVLAFLYFSEQKVDIAVVETGLGGRLDATNVLLPEVCAITSISFDHMAQLGGTLEQIAAEKAGVFKESVPVVSAPQPDSVRKVLKKAAAEVKTPLHFAGEDIAFSYRFESSRTGGPQARICVSTPTSHFDHLAVPLVGKHQAINCGVAIGVLDQLKNRGFTLNDESSVTGLSRVSLEGRMEMLCEKPRVLTDGAHNAASIEALMRAIGQNIPCDSMVIIFGCCADKDVTGMLRVIQLGADKIIFTRVKSPRSADPSDLSHRFAELSGRMAQVAQNLPEALEIAQKAITREDLICITGSFYLVAEAKQLFASHPHRTQPATQPVPV